MDRKKTIEEMMIDCQCTEKNTLSLRCRGKDCDTCRLEKLIDAGYCKIPEDAVVLMKEEYEDMQMRIAYLQEELGKLLRGDNISVSSREYGQLLYVNENKENKENSKEAIKRLRQETCPATYMADFDKEECLKTIKEDLEFLEILKDKFYIKFKNCGSWGSINIIGKDDYNTFMLPTYIAYSGIIKNNEQIEFLRDYLKEVNK